MMLGKGIIGGLVLGIGAALAGTVGADVRLPKCISDNMVVQRDMDLKVWGWADAGENVSVMFGKLKGETKADEKGTWLVKLGTPVVSSKPAELTVKGKNTIVVKNVLVGEVWLCSGQSNMEMSVAKVPTCGYGGVAKVEEEVQKANYPTIRLLNVAPTKVKTPKPAEDVKPTWEVCSAETVKAFSATGYFFGRDLNETLKVPVGLINASWGGSPVEQWIPMEAYLSDPALSEFKPKVEGACEKYSKAKAAYPELLKKWQEKTNELAKKNPGILKDAKHLRSRPQEPQAPGMGYGGMYNGNIAPFLNYSIRGAIWYQGESNASNAAGYRKSFPAMIRAWRKAFGQEEMPFLFVQLANYKANAEDPNVRCEWAELREAQTMTLSLAKTGMAVIIDVGDVRNIHPKDKQTVGHRLALAAQAVAYGDAKVVYSGPMFESMKVEGGKVRVSFKHVGGGLTVKGEKIVGFALAGADGKYYRADAAVDGETVVVSCKEVGTPKSVRYGWGNDPQCNVYNKEGLPASPFRAGE